MKIIYRKISVIINEMPDIQTIASTLINNPLTKEFDGEWHRLVNHINIKLTVREKIEEYFFIFLINLPVHKQKVLDINICEGFCSDFGTVPRIFRWLVRKDGPSRLAFIVHDFLYSKNTNMCDRKSADVIMRTIAKNNKTPFVERWLAYWTVRFFAKRAWKNTPIIYKFNI